ncbi:MAG: trehalose-phosphatase [Acidimicrobiia bacterium]
MSEGARALSLDQAVARLGVCQRLVVASDFDGTLAPIVARPEQAVPDRRALASLARLAGHDGVVVAVVSGRRFGELQELIGELPGVVLIGEHGSDRGEEDEVEDQVVAGMAAFVGDLAGRIPGSALEVKRHGVGFHYRRAEESAAAEAVASIVSWAKDRPQIKVTEGKKIVELSVAPYDKGDAVTALKDELGADCVVFIGDDTTDESVFANLGTGDIGIKVGPGETGARYRVSDISSVVEVLEAIERALG